MTARAGHSKLDRCDVYVGRGSRWGNPYVRPGMAQWSRHRVLEVEDPIAAYEAHVRGSPELLDRLRELRGKSLGCYCVRLGSVQPPVGEETCHAQVLARLVNACAAIAIAPPGASTEEPDGS